jgi:hypothetical protein
MGVKERLTTARALLCIPPSFIPLCDGEALFEKERFDSLKLQNNKTGEEKKGEKKKEEENNNNDLLT